MLFARSNPHPCVGRPSGMRGCPRRFSDRQTPSLESGPKSARPSPIRPTRYGCELLPRSAYCQASLNHRHQVLAGLQSAVEAGAEGRVRVSELSSARTAGGRRLADKAELKVGVV
jgi:hypothetical protein